MLGPTPPRSRRSLGVAALVAAIALGAPLALLPAAPAHAGGLEIPDNGTRALMRGGAFVARADDATAVIYNPGALSKIDGTNVLIDWKGMWKHASFTRQPTDLPQGQDYGFDAEATVHNQSPFFGLGGSLFAATDFGLDGFAMGVGFYGPSAHGSSSWPVDGGQRYMLTKFEALLAYASVSLAYGDGETWGVGVTGQYVIAPQLRMDLVVDGTQAGPLSAYYSATDVVASIEMSDLASGTLLVGAFFRPVPELEIGVSGRVIPVYLDLEGDFSLSNVPGQTQFSDANLAVTDSSAALDLALPPIARLGLRYRHLGDDGRELFDVELDVVYEAWSMLDEYNVDLEGTINLFVAAEAPDAIIPKAWRDTVSVRLGGTANVLHLPDPEGGWGIDLDVSLGGFFETGATPNGYEHLDFMSFMRGAIGFGVELDVGMFGVAVAYSHVFQEDRTVDERFGKVTQVRPLDECPDSCDGGAGWTGVPSNAGTFESSYDQLSIALEARF